MFGIVFFFSNSHNTINRVFNPNMSLYTLTGHTVTMPLLMYGEYMYHDALNLTCHAHDLSVYMFRVLLHVNLTFFGGNLFLFRGIKITRYMHTIYSPERKVADENLPLSSLFWDGEECGNVHVVIRAVFAGDFCTYSFQHKNGGR